MNGRHQVLVCYDFGPNADCLPALRDTDARGRFKALTLAIVGYGAYVEHVTTVEPHWRTGDDQFVARITFDRNHLRDTQAHALGCVHGFVVHVEPHTERTTP